MGSETATEMRYWFVYRNGRFEAEPPPSADCDDDVLRSLGYGPSQSFGDTDGVSFELFEREDSFCVIFQTASRFCYLFCHSWPDLIDLLARLAPIALAGLTSDKSDGQAFLRVGPLEGNRP